MAIPDVAASGPALVLNSRLKQQIEEVEDLCALCSTFASLA